MANLRNDLGSAVVTLITAQSARFSNLGSAGATLRVEYGDSQPTRFAEGAAGGRCFVSPDVEMDQSDDEYEESAQATYHFALLFDSIDRNNKRTAKAIVAQAMKSTFGDRGAQLWASFTDNGSNRLGSNGVVRLGSVTDETVDPDKPRIVARLEITLYHPIPLG